jgi:hypothetical protein
MMDKNYSLYYFHPNAYDLEYFIMAEGVESALQGVKNYLETKVKEEANTTHFRFYFDEYKAWEKATINNLPRKYNIRVFPPNVVIESELA